MKPNGAFHDTPAAGFTGEDRFTYQVEDTAGNIVEAEVTIYAGSEAPFGSNDFYVVELGETIVLDVLQNDLAIAGGTTLSIATMGVPDQGTLELIDGEYEYTAPADWSGEIEFEYTVTDGTETSEPIRVEILILSEGLIAFGDYFEMSHGGSLVLDAESGLLGNDFGSDNMVVFDPGSITATNGTIVVASDGSLTYTPAPGFVGTDSFEYSATDESGATDISTVSISVTNPAPETMLLEVEVDEDGSLVLALSLDSDKRRSNSR